MSGKLYLEDSIFSHIYPGSGLDVTKEKQQGQQQVGKSCRRKVSVNYVSVLSSGSVSLSARYLFCINIVIHQYISC